MILRLFSEAPFVKNTVYRQFVLTVSGTLKFICCAWSLNINCWSQYRLKKSKLCIIILKIHTTWYNVCIFQRITCVAHINKENAWILPLQNFEIKAKLLIDNSVCIIITHYMQYYTCTTYILICNIWSHMYNSKSYSAHNMPTQSHTTPIALTQPHNTYNIMVTQPHKKNAIALTQPHNTPCIMLQTQQHNMLLWWHNHTTHNHANTTTQRSIVQTQDVTLVTQLHNIPSS